MATHSSKLPGKSHGQKSLVGYSPWSQKGNLQPEVSALDQEITEGDSDIMEMLKLLVFGTCPACRSLSLQLG